LIFGQNILQNCHLRGNFILFAENSSLFAIISCFSHNYWHKRAAMIKEFIGLTFNKGNFGLQTALLTQVLSACVDTIIMSSLKLRVVIVSKNGL